jgi:hypothetical protein
VTRKVRIKVVGTVGVGGKDCISGVEGLKYIIPGNGKFAYLRREELCTPEEMAVGTAGDRVGEPLDDSRKLTPT